MGKLKTSKVCVKLARKGTLTCAFVTLALLTALVLIYSGVIVHHRRAFYFILRKDVDVHLSLRFDFWKSLDFDNATVTSSIPSKETVSGENEKVKLKTTRNVNASELAFSGITLKPEFVAMINASAPKYAIDASYTIENPTLCSSATNLTVLIIVHTAPKHFEHRQVIRQTWANNKCYINLGVVRILFLLGLVKDKNLQKGLEEEFRQHEDLLQGNFIDDYHNLTHKGVMAYKWITERCRNAKLILKSDDDVVINMYLFMTKYAQRYMAKGRQVLCKRLRSQAVLRNKRSKWYVNENQFRNYTHYTAYCQGFMVMMTNDIVPDLYKSATITPFFWIDDIFLYGLVPANVPNITYTHLKFGTEAKFVSQRAIDCYTNKTMSCNYLAVVGNYKLSKKVWGNMTQRQLFGRNNTCQL